MKKKYIYISISFVILLLFGAINIFAEEKTLYETYNQRVAEICKPYGEDSVPISNDIREYDDIDKDLPDLAAAQETYRDNMNNIYNCAMMGAQIRSLDLILTQKNISTDLKTQINDQKKKVEKKMSAMECNLAFSNPAPLQKAEVLKQTTYQTCKYNAYLIYLKKHHDSVYTAIKATDQESYTITQVVDIAVNNKRKIDNEIDHIYKVFPMAYQAYNEYENNIGTHYLLQAVKKDYVSLRKNLHEVLNPMNQFVYKVSNVTKSN